MEVSSPIVFIDTEQSLNARTIVRATVLLLLFSIQILVGWLFWGLTTLRDSISVYIGPFLREREKQEKNDRREKKMSKQPAPTTSAVGPFPTIIQISRTPLHWKSTQQHPTIPFDYGCPMTSSTFKRRIKFLLSSGLPPRLAGYSQSRSNPSKPCNRQKAITDWMNWLRCPAVFTMREKAALPAFQPPIAMSVLRFLDLDFSALNLMYLIKYQQHL